MEEGLGRNLDRALWDACGALDLVDLGARAIGPLVSALGASGALLYRFDDRKVPEGVAGNLACVLPEYVKDLFEDDPLQQALIGRSLTDPVLTTSGLDPRSFRKSRAYRYFYRPNDVEHLLGMSLLGAKYGEPGMAGVVFTRSQRQLEFSDSDARLVERVQAVLGSVAVRIARTPNAATLDGALEILLDHAFPGEVVAFDGRGRIVWLSGQARAHLRASELKELGLMAQSWCRDGFAGPVIRNVTWAGRSLQLTLLRARTDEWLVLARLKSSASTDFSELTPAELTVLGAIGEGLSNGQIAERQAVSIETIRTHVSRILQKLQIPNRVRAALIWQRHQQTNQH